MASSNTSTESCADSKMTLADASPTSDQMGKHESNTALTSDSKTSLHPPDGFPSPPDGGLRAWTQVLVGHLVSFNSWGYLNSFGLFQAYYATTLSATPSAISWIGSVQILLNFLVGCVSGRALDAGHLRATLALGMLLQLVGIFTSSVATQYWHLLLAQGICKGLGDGLMFCPAVAVVPTYFTTKRAAAMAIAAAGTATGGLVFPIIAQQLQPRIGFAWTVRVMGFVVVFNSVLILLLARARLPPRKAGPLLEWRAFKERGYTLFCVGMFLVWWALYFAFFYVSAFAKTHLGVDTSTSLTLLLVSNAVGAPGRIVAGLVADRYFGPLNVMIPGVFCAAVLMFAWAGVHSLAAFYVFCVLYGFFAAVVQTLFTSACASLTPNMNANGSRTGMCFAVVSFAALTGAPIGGALIQLNHGSYLYAQIFGGTSLMAGAAALLAAKFSYKRA
ncbi:major facilitator superfamily domain-containing protein [Lasiosphaeria ovina]|uniref:Major facilitator superfamily domain-containing protein n=1 Tax=Lasiosphaeria ovina TaxID=92902 RepID=A0AAE0K7I2_9PEZI|nr:major facilitator superfamily domain-containing protein [Lasiosphaeria ovina]